MTHRPFVLSAVLATIVITVALSPLIAAIPIVDTQFPKLFDRMFMLSYVGMPGMLIARVLFGDTWNKATLPAAIIGSWSFYYVFFRFLIWLLRQKNRDGVRA